MQVDIQTLFIFFGIFSFAFGLGLAFIPSLIKYVNKKRKAHEAIFKDSIEILRTIRKSGKGYYEISEDQERDKLLENSMTPKRLCKKFWNLEKQIIEYNEWLLDSGDIVNFVVKSKVNELKDHPKWISLVNQLDYNDSLTSHISHLIYDDNLTTGATKEVLFQHCGRDYEIDPIDGSKTVRLKEFVDSGDFYKLIYELKGLENRASLRMLREARKNFLDKVDDILKWIRKR